LAAFGRLFPIFRYIKVIFPDVEIILPMQSCLKLEEMGLIWLKNSKRPHFLPRPRWELFKKRQLLGVVLVPAPSAQHIGICAHSDCFVCRRVKSLFLACPIP
jgi:hypothetical protein